MLDVNKVRQCMEELDCLGWKSIFRYPPDPDENYGEPAARFVEKAGDSQDVDELAKIMRYLFFDYGTLLDVRTYYRTVEKILGLTDGHACPVCRTTWFEKTGKFDICPRCCWEDDPTQLADPFFKGGANIFSLNESRFIFYMENDMAEESMDYLKTRFSGDRDGFMNTLIEIYLSRYTAKDMDYIMKIIYGK